MFATYILASQRNGTIYVGSTDDLARRVWEHREKMRPGFTTRYGVSQLVWFERHETREDAFRRERRIKEWRRSWKILLIEDRNPDWRDLYEDLTGGGLKPDDWLAALDSGTARETPVPLIWVPAFAGMSGKDFRGQGAARAQPASRVRPRS